MESKRDRLEKSTVKDQQESNIESSSSNQEQDTTDQPLFNSIQKRLDEFEERMKIEGDRKLSQANRSHSPRDSVCLYRAPPSIKSVFTNFFHPWRVCIGPYTRPQESYMCYPIVKQFEDSTKPELVNSLVNQTSEEKELVLQRLVCAMEGLETKVCYSLPIGISSNDHVGVMLFDGCFVVELLRQVCIDDNDENLRHNSPIFVEDRLITDLTRDLLLQENQLPFFVLEKIFDICIKKDGKSDPLRLVALKLFSRFLPISHPLKRAVSDPNFKVEDLLHLFHYSCTNPILNPQNYDQRQPMTRRFSRWISVAFRYLFNLFQRVKASPETITPTQQGYHRLSIQSMQCATRLRRAGIKFKPRRSADSFLQIEFRNGVLEIPPITYDKIIDILINCVAWEQCHPDTSKCFSTYVDFMSYLIKSDKDVTFLREEGIIRSIRSPDQMIVDIFKNLANEVFYADTDCYLSEQVKEMEIYCSSNWVTLRRTYFSSPWAFISVAAATVVLVLTGIQTIMAILAYVKPPS